MNFLVWAVNADIQLSWLMLKQFFNHLRNCAVCDEKSSHAPAFDVVNHFRQLGIHCGLSSKAYGKMQWLFHSPELLLNCLRVAFEPLQIFNMGFDAAINNLFRLINNALSFRPRVVYVTPAKHAAMVAVKCRAHLDAAPAFNAIEGIFIADILALYGFFAVFADLYSAMVAYNPVAFTGSFNVLQFLLVLLLIQNSKLHDIKNNTNIYKFLLLF